MTSPIHLKDVEKRAMDVSQVRFIGMMKLIKKTTASLIEIIDVRPGSTDAIEPNTPGAHKFAEREARRKISARLMSDIPRMLAVLEGCR